MNILARSSLICAMALLMGLSSLAAQEPVYTPPELFRGALYLVSSSSSPANTTGSLELTETQSSILQAEIARTNNEGWLVGLATPQSSEQSALWKLLSGRAWVEPPTLWPCSQWNDDLAKRLRELKRGSCIWVDHAQLQATSGDQRPTWAKLLQECLQRGVVLVLETRDSQPGQRIADQWNLIPDVDLVYDSTQPLAARELTADRVRLQLTNDCLVRIGRRELVNLSEAEESTCVCHWPATNTYTEPLQEAIRPRRALDLVAARRALLERAQPVFPADQDYRPQLASGSLVIVGGGGTPPEIWERFVELAGGKDARIVVLPTAVAEPEYEEDDEARLLKRFGAGEVRMLPQYTRDEVSKEEFLSQLRWATGIWFGGGRQWRFVDAYWATPAWQEIKQVLSRGGVIGGSSAGATIQGDLLVRGHPLGNTVMICDGYRRGLGLLEGVAIDQHFRQRNRFDDLASVAKRFPKIWAVGIDEGTALVVESPNQCSVLGRGSVWMLPPHSVDQKYIEYPSGDSFTLGTHPLP